MNKYRHLTYDDRLTIEKLLKNGTSFKAIGRTIGKDCTTVSKEIRGRIRFRRTGGYGRPFNDCLHRAHCQRGSTCQECPYTIPCRQCTSCHKHCPRYEKETCPRLAHPPYVCNACTKKHLCTLEKQEYSAREAQKEYQLILKESRCGIALSEEEVTAIDEYITPLIRKGQSLNHILVNGRDQIMCSEKTVRNYIHQGIFTVRNIDLPDQVRYRPRKSNHDHFKVDKACRIGRTYDDYLTFLEPHPHLSVVQMDTLEGTKGGACLLTMVFTDPRFTLAFWRQRNTARSVLEHIDWLYEALGHDDFVRLFPVILLDNGSEFSDPGSIEFKDGKRRTLVFYCDPAVPSQKGAVENANKSYRRIFPKGKSLDGVTQEQVMLASNHINSFVRFSVGQRSAYETFAFLYGEGPLKKMGAELIAHDQIVLHPNLLK